MVIPKRSGIDAVNADSQRDIQCLVFAVYLHRGDADHKGVLTAKALRKNR